MKTFWYKGDDFGVTCFNDFTFNSGAKLGYTFHVDSLDSGYATITFTATSTILTIAFAKDFLKRI